MSLAEETYLDRALRRLKRLNTLEDRNGRSLTSAIRVYDFETWWFHQDDLFWRILVPITRHETLFEDCLREGAPPESCPPELKDALTLLAPHLAGLSDWRPHRASKSRARRLRQLLLVAQGLIGLGLARLLRRDTILFTFDQVSPGLRTDFRIEELDDELRRRAYRAVEYVHARGADGYRSSLNNVLRRRRLSVPFEKVAGLLGRRIERRPVTPPVIAGLGTSAEDRLLRAAVLWNLERAAASCGLVEALVRMLRFQSARRAVLLDSRRALPLAAACAVLGVPTLGVMHGLFNRYHPVFMAYGFADARRHSFDLYGVWSEYFAHRLTEGDLFDSEKVFACGPLRSLERAPGTLPAARPKINVLLLSEPRAQQEEVAAYVRTLKGDSRFRLTLKTRPGEVPPYLARAGVDLSGIDVLSTGSVYDALAQTHVVVGTYSSVLYEAALVERPAVVLRTSFPYGHELAEDGLADFASGPATVCEVVAQAAATPAEECRRRREVIWGTEIQSGAGRLLDVAERRLWKSPGSPTT